MGCLRSPVHRLELAECLVRFAQPLGDFGPDLGGPDRVDRVGNAIGLDPRLGEPVAAPQRPSLEECQFSPGIERLALSNMGIEFVEAIVILEQ